MRTLLLIGLWLFGPTAYGATSVTLAIGHVEAGPVDADHVELQWRSDGPQQLRAARLRVPGLDQPVRLTARCPQAATPRLSCRNASLALSSEAFGSIDTRVDVDLATAQQLTLRLRALDARLSYNRADGRLATDSLRITGTATLRRNGNAWALDAELRSPSGQAYAEPIFMDFGEHPATLSLRARSRDSRHIKIGALDWSQPTLADVHVSGDIDATAPLQRHALDLHIVGHDLEPLARLAVQPLLAGTRLQQLEATGTARIDAALADRQLNRVATRFDLPSARLPGFGLAADGLHGALTWQEGADTPSPDSELRWDALRVGRVPVGTTRMRLRTQGRSLSLLEPARIPVLDGAIDIDTLRLADIGDDAMSADFAARIEPIDLGQLAQALDWPAFGGSISGAVPGLTLRDRRIELDGVLRADAFNGRIELSRLSIIDPFGVLPRISTDIALRQLDLARLTSAFDFGRIEGRLDGDVTGLRMIGWEPVAMHARLYSTPDDRSRHRISQRAIDNISSIGGGPTGLLSKGFMSLFEDFAYDRIGWSCVLENGVCRMNGVKPGPGGRGYVLVKGKGLPRIDVVGYSTEVNWRTFMAQLRSVGNSGPAQVR